MVDEVKIAPRRHHGVDAAKQFREQNAAVYSEPGTEPAAPAAPAPVPAPAEPAAPAPAPAPAEPAAPVDLSIFDFGLDPAAPAAADPTQPSERELQLQQEIEQLRAQNGQLTAAQQQALERHQAEQQELEELRALRRQLEVDKLMSLEGLEMETIDPAAAQEIGAKVIRPVLERQQQAFEKRLAEVQSTLEADRKEREQLVSRMTEGERNAMRNATNEKIFAAHPDFAQLRQTKEFNQFLNSTVRGSSLKLEKLIADEYHSGNADFVIQAINEFKKGRPSLEDVASVQAAGTGSEPASGADDEPQFTEDDVAKWNQMVVTGDMTRAEFRENMAKYRAARAPAK
jgi:uncharacterized protein (UPF0216 family)